MAMQALPEVLVLEDDPEQLATLVQAIRKAGLEPLAARSPKQALSRLRNFHPIMAILDLDMSQVPLDERAGGVHEVLRQVHSRHVNCIPLVYSAAVETIDEQAEVFGAHPHALFQSKRHGLDQLVRRVDGLLSARVGDLAVQGGMVVHLPGGASHSHRVAVSLVTATRANRTLYLNDSDARAARRFQRWLEEVGSQVGVRPLGGRFYQLAVGGAGEGRAR
jgi:CheY-like chemotaxis protein